MGKEWVNCQIGSFIKKLLGSEKEENVRKELKIEPSYTLSIWKWAYRVVSHPQLPLPPFYGLSIVFIFCKAARAGWEMLWQMFNIDADFCTFADQCLNCIKIQSIFKIKDIKTTYLEDLRLNWRDYNEVSKPVSCNVVKRIL